MGFLETARRENLKGGLWEAIDMARKGKNKNKKKASRRRYNQKQFTEVFCTSCNICHKNANPAFCYVELYRHEPKVFVSRVYNNLVDVRHYYESSGKIISGIGLEQFANMFCITGICHNGNSDKGLKCPAREDCYRLFRSQLGASGHILIHDNPSEVREAVSTGSRAKDYVIYNKKKNRRKKRSGRLVVQAYPTFFSSQNEKFQEAIKAILNGDNNIEQDKGEEPAGLHEGTAGGGSKS